HRYPSGGAEGLLPAVYSPRPRPANVTTAPRALAATGGVGIESAFGRATGSASHAKGGTGRERQQTPRRLPPSSPRADRLTRPTPRAGRPGPRRLADRRGVPAGPGGAAAAGAGVGLAAAGPAGRPAAPAAGRLARPRPAATAGESHYSGGPAAGRRP